MKLARRWTGFAAAVWALLFTLLSPYWAAGGTAGAETIGDAITDPVGPVLADRRSTVPRRNAILPDARASNEGHASTKDGSIGQ